MTTHIIKISPAYFDRVLDGSKTFEVRKNDRGYQAGDFLCLEEFREINGVLGLTGRTVTKRVTYVLVGGGHGIDPDYAVLALGKPR